MHLVQPRQTQTLCELNRHQLQSCRKLLSPHRTSIHPSKGIG
jgi:hypothetical protein